MDDDGGGEVGLFEDVVFAVMPNDLDDNQIEQVRTALMTGGGQYMALRETDQRIDDESLDSITHIIATSIDFPQYERALELGIAIVKPSWVSQSVLKKRVSATRMHTPDPAQFFHDVVVTFAGLPEGDVENLIAGVIALGGQYSQNLSKLVTHIVTTDDTSKKCQLAMDKMPHVKMVLPHWFDDCFKLGKMINERPYMFPDPEILRSGLNGTSVRGAQSPELDGAITVNPQGEPSPTPPSSPTNSRKNLNALMLRKIYLSSDLQISAHLRATLKKLCTHAGAVIVKSVDKADVFIGQYRDGSEYVEASRQEDTIVANLAWLFHVINYNKYVSPLQRLFHYPIPRHPIPGFENQKISISNYSGDARVYVENLIRYCGAEYTKTMKQDNTHLVAAHMHGEKCEAAQEWNVNIVNHLWLEESYAKCAYQTLTNPKYNHFPTRTNLGEVAGRTALDMKSIEKNYFPKPKTPHKVQKTSPRKAPASSTKQIPSDLPHPMPADETEADVPTTILAADEMDVDTAPTTAKRRRGRPSKSEQATPRFVDEEKENESPSVTSTGRAAKAKAIDVIHSQAPDISLFQKQMKRKGGVIHGGRRGSTAEEDNLSSPAPVRRTSKKRPSDEYEVTAVGSALSDGETQAEPSGKQTKKAKLAAALPPVKYKMMVTGDDRWQSDARKESADKNTLRSIGVLLTTDPKEVDILVAARLLRTRKFVCALAGAPLVVDTSFLDAALKQKKLIENPPILQDREGEQRMGFTLASSLERAKINDRKLFNGWSIFVTKDVKGGFETYKDIITLNGGTALLYTGRTGLNLPKRKIEDIPGAESQNQGGEAEYDFVYLVSGESEAELKLWGKFRDMAHKQGLEARIVGTEWLVCSGLSQKVEWQAKWELKEEKIMSQRNG